MMSARLSTLASLRGHIERMEMPTGGGASHRVALGHAEADSALRGGLAAASVHEVFAQGHQSTAATGFVTGLAARVSARRPLVWVRQDFCDLEAGTLSMNGLAEFGLDPRCLVTVRAADIESALRTAADALACDALGAVVLEVWGEARQLDLVASRKLTLTAQASGATCLLLRIAASPLPSTAETRWIVRAAHSPPEASLLPAAPLLPATLGNGPVWGAPRFEAELVRNRHGPTGRWIMEWKCDECLFSETADPQPVAATPAHRPHQAGAGERRRAGERRAG